MSKQPMKSREELYNYWRNPEEGNHPDKYIVPVERSRFLHQYIKKYVTDPNASILEPGCNVGRNLNYLYQAGYKDLTGIEISENAVNLLKETYPDLAREAAIYNAPIEDVIATFKTNQFDMVYAMAVLEHIHPDSDWIFAEMARIAKSYIITIEAESSVTERHFPRNYKLVFEPFGFQQIEEETNCIRAGLGQDFIARVFENKCK
ncbi:class I SAM-dependent methyltransferase [Brevibacillus humidisoli]|uniref:class I SAM-dependent methyltransferase n=1 Tax=Brevibacillus humidisoli TaxID=2895522 RepID=UPI001E4CEFF8|nr:class I SAM-dependent methyltransferase [Brevibacillus humidisoli]UFJ42541.1 class I SAM-dependent methyltransferase [Brevibacillus humidisoli]